MREQFDLGPDKRRTFFAGKIVFNNMCSVIDCTVVEVSASGARLKVVSPLGVPGRFTLRINELKEERVCEVKSRSINAIGVAFVEGLTPPKTSPNTWRLRVVT